MLLDFGDILLVGLVRLIKGHGTRHERIVRCLPDVFQPIDVLYEDGVDFLSARFSARRAEGECPEA